jgi:hypothetical protein
MPPAFRRGVIHRSIGPLKTFAYLGSKASGKGRLLYYRAEYKEATLYYTILLTAEGKIAFFAGEPEEKI